MPHLCPICGGVFGFEDELIYDADIVEPDLPGIWRYRNSFSLPEGSPLITLGEGNTPLIWSKVFGNRIGFRQIFIYARK